MALLQKPKSKAMQNWVWLSGIFLAVLVGYYVIATLDFLPDTGPLGFLDDIILVILLVFTISQLYRRVSGRWSTTRAKYSELFRTGNIWAIISKPRTWGILFVIGAAVAYIFWAMDVFPDGTPLGLVDDAIAAISALLVIIRLYNKK